MDRRQHRNQRFTPQHAHVDIGRANRRAQEAEAEVEGPVEQRVDLVGREHLALEIQVDPGKSSRSTRASVGSSSYVAEPVKPTASRPSVPDATLFASTPAASTEARIARARSR
jgi:hypothetical protein